MTEITQADRDAALHLAMRAGSGLHPRDVQQVLEGRHDKNAIVQAFARHRKYGYDQGYYDGRQFDRMEERAAIVAWLRSDKIVLSMDGSAEEVANAIEAGDHWRPFV